MALLSSENISIVWGPNRYWMYSHALCDSIASDFFKDLEAPSAIFSDEGTNVRGRDGNLSGIFLLKQHLNRETLSTDSPKRVLLPCYQLEHAPDFLLVCYPKITMHF